MRDARSSVFWIWCAWLAIACGDLSFSEPQQKLGSGAYQQGLWAGRDPKATFRNGTYYYIEHSMGGLGLIFKSKTALQRGEPKILPPGFPLVVLSFVEELGGKRYDQWFAFGPDTWRLDGADPYDNADKWTKVGSFGFGDFVLDFNAFQAESGPHVGEWFLVWAGNDNNKPGEWGFESLFLSRIKSPTQLEFSDCAQAPVIVPYYARTVWNATRNDWDWIPGHPLRPMPYPVPDGSKGGWKDVIAEAPHVVQKDGTISLIYSGDGAHTVHYGMGIAFSKDGDVDRKDSWVDYNQQIKADPEFQWDLDKGVFGPGVASVVPSPDGKESWMYYHSKTFHTWNPQDPANEEGQSNKEMWTRFINLKKIGWHTIQHEGQTLTLPELGTPTAPGAPLAQPAGDPGRTPRKSTRIEAEFMIPFGNGMGAINSTPGLTGNSDKASLRAYIQNLEALSREAPESKSGLIYRNCPAATQLVVAAASSSDSPLLHLYVNGQKAQDLPFQKTGAPDVFVENKFQVSIPEGAEIRLVHEQGKCVSTNVDYLELESTDDPAPQPTDPAIPADPTVPPPSDPSLNPATPQNPAPPSAQPEAEIQGAMQVVGNGCATVSPSGLLPWLVLLLVLRRRRGLRGRVCGILRGPRRKGRGRAHGGCPAAAPRSS